MADNGWKACAIQVLEDNRGLVVLLFCLPASLIFNFALQTWLWIHRKFSSTSKDHEKKVKEVQRRVAEWNKKPAKSRKLLCTARPNWQSLSTTFFRKDRCEKIPIELYDVLELNEKELYVKVEPMVTVEHITKFLIPKGFTLAVTLEIGEATLGGLAFGTGMTTHSHKVGLYQESIISYDVVLADGSLINVREDNEHSELFRALPWSHGSLCFLVALEIKIIPVKPYVHMTYVPISGQSNYCRIIQDLSGANEKDKATPQFLEATIFSKNDCVVMIGNFADRSEYPKLRVNRVCRWYKPWFYKYVETFLQLKNEEYDNNGLKVRHEELIPLRDYLLRHNRSLFWVVEDMLPFGNALFFRLVFGWLLPPKIAFLKFTTTPGIRELTFTKQVFQDIVLPLSKLKEQVDKSEQLFDLYPLLVYPCRVYDHGPNKGQVPRPKTEYICPGTNYALYNDLGIYGVPGFVKRKQPYDPVNAMREMEKFTRQLKGFSFLYADIFMTEEEFNEMFDLTCYQNMRTKYGATNSFPTLYAKVKPEIDVQKIGEKYRSS